MRDYANKVVEEEVVVPHYSGTSNITFSAFPSHEGYACSLHVLEEASSSSRGISEFHTTVSDRSQWQTLTTPLASNTMMIMRACVLCYEWQQPRRFAILDIFHKKNFNNYDVEEQLERHIER